MEEELTELYSAEDLAGLERRVKRRRLACVLLGAAGLAACVVLLCLADTRSAARMERAAILTSIGAGWAVLFIALFPLTDAAHELSHARTLREGPRELLRGTVSAVGEPVAIRGSVTVQKLRLADGDSVRQLHIISGKAARLLAAGGPVTVAAAHGYVAAYGEAHEHP